MSIARTQLRRGAGLLMALWLCAWLAPILHQAQCSQHHAADNACPFCQLAATAVIHSPTQTTPTPVRIPVQSLPRTWTTAPALLFQLEHPPRGPPQLFSAV